MTANRRSSPAKRRLEAAPAFTGSLATTFTVAPGLSVHLEASSGTFEGPGAKGAGATSTDLSSLRYVPPGDSTGVALLRASLDSVNWVEAAARYAPQTGAPFSIEAAVAAVTTDVGVAVALDFTLRGGGEFVEVALAGDGVLSVVAASRRARHRERDAHRGGARGRRGDALFSESSRRRRRARRRCRPRSATSRHLLTCAPRRRPRA